MESQFSLENAFLTLTEKKKNLEGPSVAKAEMLPCVQ